MVATFDSSPGTLRSLEAIRPLYFLPGDPFADEVLIPCFQASDRVDCMVGFFSGQVLADLAPGLATYINASTNSFRLVISPLLRQEDLLAIEEGVKPAEAVAGVVLEELIVTEGLLQAHTLKCLSWLLRSGRLEIRVALLDGALFHPKVWMFTDRSDVLAAHGSSNVTYAGIRRNVEQVAVSRSWEDPNQRYITDKLSQRFRDFWSNTVAGCTVIALPQAVEGRLLETYATEHPPTEAELRALYRRSTRVREPSTDPAALPAGPRPEFTIPPALRFEDGPFEHQGRAAKAWLHSGGRGILEMATGSGKTITAMICAHRLYDTHKPLLIVASAPYRPLVQQWCDEIAPFGLKPTNLTLSAGRRGRASQLGRIRRRLSNGTSSAEAVVVSHRTLCDDAFRSELERFTCTRLLIADEVHNLGAEGFVADQPEFFEYRLGLSATPIRQYDDEGTRALLSFFGPIAFRFTLEEAIGRCLVEYDYFLHPVGLTRREMGEWNDLTAAIRANAWRQEAGDLSDYVAKLLRDRRALLDNAEGKIPALNEALEREDPQTLRYTLIYASDKSPGQLDNVNALLRAHGVLFHQLTHEETANRDDMARIIRAFQEGTLRVLTAKRVLDEGVNIPQVDKAFILASTTVERQWVQRRGRLLRTCRETGKTHSEIHDFVALPPSMDHVDEDAKALVRSELARLQAFARLARNAGRPDGPLAVIHRLVAAAFL